MKLDIVLKMAGSLISYLDERERNKYSDEYYEIKVKYYEEIKKPSLEYREEYPDLRVRDFKSNAVLDDCERRLRILCEALTATGREP